ncbi:hypothetical protein AGMMS4957_02790 [Bacteroidia bacterium]|nr:hypothetical protein AGMMS4957_02790 [Bacteroidia bacterium]
MKHIQMKTFRTVAILLLLPLFSKGYSQDNVALIPFPNGIQIFYFVTNMSELKRDYLENADAMDAVATLFNTPGVYDKIVAIEIASASSPNGTMERIERLSRERAQALYDYLVQTYPQINPAIITKKKLAVDIEEFRSIVESELDFPGRADVMSILNNNYDENTLVNQLALLPPTVRYYLRAHIYPKLQYARVRILQKPEAPVR